MPYCISTRDDQDKDSFWFSRIPLYILNVVTEKDDLDPNSGLRRVKRIDERQFQETADNYTRINIEKNHEDLKYKNEQQYDYVGPAYEKNTEDYYGSDESYENSSEEDDEDFYAAYSDGNRKLFFCD
ncbi:hypothetical protein HNY73_001176 [Argiope bruennichi]|uniref:Uncharacterized protein n=1 Tax=Argiope bruennichi TaxID=94029 RepID=A0A8T0G6J2_ARGBR|nr:hypothetical protein HNY73_001176 [Argiope bruennichi]